MIEALSVSKRFNDLEALHDVSLNVGEGQIYGLVGCNGAGKTTLLKTLAGIYKPDNGEVRIAGRNAFDSDEARLRCVFIADFPYFFYGYTLAGMAAFYRSIYPSWDQERFQRLQKVFNIDGKQRIRTLSKGLQRQVAFWLALSVKPDVLILDEPLDGLDPVMRQKVKSLLYGDIADSNMAVVISSHNLRELEGACDHIGILHEGRMVLQRDLDDLKSEFHKVQMAFQGGVPEALLQEPDISGLEVRGSVLVTVIKGPHEEITARISKYKPAILDILPLTLEEIFLYEMGEYGYDINIVLD